MQDALVALKNAIDSSDNSISEIEQNILQNCTKLYVGQYIGNSQNNVRVQWGDDKNMTTVIAVMISIGNNTGGGPTRMMCVGLKDVIFFHGNSSSNLALFLDDPTYVFRIADAQNYTLNNNGMTYNYLALGI